MKKKVGYLITPLITAIIVLIIYYMNDLYPFEMNSIVQVDADYQFIPVMYKLYDIIHGDLNIFYSGIGLGNSIYTSLIIQGSLFSPLTLLLYFTSRDNIINYFNIIILIKIALISLTSYIYFKYKYKTNEFYIILFSIIYTFSGWVILNYFNIMWLDSVILFPLIILFLDKLIYEGKYYGYVIVLALSIIISYYISLFILIFIFIYSFLNIFVLLKKEKRKKTILLLGISTLNAILISSFSLIPSLFHTFTSSRLSNNGHYELFNNTINKILYLMGLSLPFILFILMNFNCKDDKKNIYVYRILLILYSIGIILEPINMALHFGSYWSFPYRYSFITCFILVSIGLYYLTKKGIEYGKVRIIPMLIVTIFSVLVVLYNHKVLDVIKDSQITLDFNDFEVFKKIDLILITFIIMKVFTLMIKNKHLTNIFLVITTLIEIFIITSWTMYYSSGYYLTKEANEANNDLVFDNEYLYRYKIDYPYYSLDYGFILRVNTLDNWLHILPDGMTDVYKSLGYLISDTSIKSKGGTIFTDNLLNMNYTISKNNLDNRIYERVKEGKEYKLYRYKTLMPFGIIYDSDNNLKTDDSGFYLHNQIYQSLFSKEDNIIDSKTIYNNHNEECFIINEQLSEENYVYLDLTYNGDNIDYIKVNDEYFYNLDNYIKYLGIYERDIDIKICPKENKDIDDVELGTIKVNKYQEFINNINQNVNVSYDNGYQIKAYSDNHYNSLFLPINNIKGYTIKLNGENIKADKYLDNFISIKLSEGENNISIKYHEPYLLISIIMSIIGVISLILSKHIRINNKYILDITYYLYLFLGACIYIYFYVYSFIK